MKCERERQQKVGSEGGGDGGKGALKAGDGVAWVGGVSL